MKRKLYYDDPIKFLTWYVANKTKGVVLEDAIQRFHDDDSFKARVMELMDIENYRRYSNVKVCSDHLQTLLSNDPELENQRKENAVIGFKNFYDSLTEEQKQEYLNIRISGFKVWFEDNRDKQLEYAKMGAEKTKIWHAENPELASEKGRKGGVIGGARKSERKTKAARKNASLGGLVRSKQKDQAIQQLFAILPDSFERLQAFSIAEEHNIPKKTVNHIIESDMVTSVQLRRPKGSGRGGRIIVYTKRALGENQ